MGMAASQARYLALVARKSNCEYEGQQINQARTALSNQSANLFNQMLGLQVPVPPSTQDFTKQQYSYTDGVNESTIDSWQQLATPEEEYNYVVTSHYYANVYTGSQKKLSDPQVQYTQGTAVTSTEMTTALRNLTASKTEYSKIQEEYEKILENYQSAQTANAEAIAAYNAAVAVQQAAVEAQLKASEEYTNAQNAVADFSKDGSTYATLKAEVTAAQEALEAKEAEAATLANYSIISANYTGVDRTGRQYDAAANSYKLKDQAGNESTYSAYSKLDDTTRSKALSSINALINTGVLPADFNITTDVYYDSVGGGLAFKEDLDNLIISATNTLPIFNIEDKDTTGSILNNVDKYQTEINAYTANYDNAVAKFDIVDEQYKELLAVEESAKIAYNNANSVLAEANTALMTATTAKLTAETNLANAQAEMDAAEETFGPTVDAYNSALAVYESYQSPSYVGNCSLTLLETLSTDQQAELKQVVTDMTELGINPAINNCFDADGNYLGGIYEFKLNGITYYSCYDDLNESFTSGTGINHIDGQTKLAYYNASYVSTKIEKTEKALLETDGNGRFTSVRFGDDTITYTLNMETVTDDDAYQDAMNQYYYENAVYDKTIQDINAKTSIIQQEDQQLELRLKQLDTEQSALSTEMEAVKKVVKDNVESSFKTFGG